MRHRGFEMSFSEFGRGSHRRLEFRERFDGTVKPTQRMTTVGQDLRMGGHRGKRGIIA